MRNENTAAKSTRRACVKFGGGVAIGALGAGCVGGDESESQSDPDGYSVSIEPVGEVTFDSVPETWLAMNGSWADMGIALGRNPPEGIVSTDRYHAHHYDDIPNLDAEKDEIMQLYDEGIDMELFYELDVDLHAFDPNFLTNRIDNLDEDDVDEIETSIAPLFGNASFSRHYDWRDGYRYYTLYELFETFAEVFQTTDRYDAFAALHEEVMEQVQDRIPPEEERPSVALLMPGSEEPDEFYPWLIEDGTGWKQWRDLGVTDALAEASVETFSAAREAIDYEVLLETDPDYLFLYSHESKTPTEFRETFLDYFRDHSSASRLSAVQNERVYRAGGFYQGPIINLALTERAARQLYPDEFDEDEQLYDRQRIGDIVAGDG